MVAMAEDMALLGLNGRWVDEEVEDSSHMDKVLTDNKR
jgi:hypothetical protein